MDYFKIQDYSEHFKRMTHHLLHKEIPDWINFNRKQKVTFTVYDIDDSVTDINDIAFFRVKEAPGWLFGIWYNIQDPNTNDDMVDITYEVFAQYETLIKPHHSSICYKDTVYNCCRNSHETSLPSCPYNIIASIYFIITEPALAFCRDALGWNYNSEYHTREEAQDEMTRILQKEEEKNAFKQYANDKLLNYVKNYWKGEKVFIHDLGESVSPRYEVTFLYDDQEDDIRPIHERIHCMHYLDYIEEFEKVELSDINDFKMYYFVLGYRKLKTQLEQETKEHNIYWWPAISSFFTFQAKSHYKEWIQRVKDQTGKNKEDELIYC